MKTASGTNGRAKRKEEGEEDRERERNREGRERTKRQAQSAMGDNRIASPSGHLKSEAEPKAATASACH